MIDPDAITATEVCIECGYMHMTHNPRCPACHGVREAHKSRLILASGVPLSQAAFDAVYGRES